MSTADDLQALAEAVHASEIRLVRAIGQLPDRPHDPRAAAAWDEEANRLDREVGRLAVLSQELAAKAVTAALGAYTKETAALREVCEHARERIARIAKVSDALTTIGRILDVGGAVLALIAAPSGTTALSLGDKVMALSDQLDATHG